MSAGELSPNRRRIAASEIEQLVGARRHDTWHVGRADHEIQQVSILHSRECLESGIDMLTDCPYSQALDLGIYEADWPDRRPVVLALVDGMLTPNPDVAPPRPPAASS